MIKNLNFSRLDVICFIIILIPPALVTGPFIPDLLVTILVFFLLFYLTKISSLKILYSYPIIFYFIWCLYHFINSFFSDYIVHSLSESLFYFRFGFLIIAISILLDHYRNFYKYLFYSLFFTLSFIVIDAIFQFTFGFNTLGYEYDKIRLSGVFGEEKKLGSFIVRFLPIFIFLFFSLKLKKSINFLSYFLIALSSIVILITNEVSAIFYLILIFIFYLFLLNINIKLKIVTLVSSLIILSTLLISFNQIPKRVLGKFFEYQDKEINFILFNEHIPIWNTSLEIYSGNYFFGTGLKNYRKICPNKIFFNDTFKPFFASKGEKKLSCSTHPHNNYIQILVEAGIFGFIPFLLFSILFFYRFLIICFHSFKLSNEYSNELITKYIIVLIPLWPFIPTGNFFNNWNSIIFFFAIGFIYREFIYKNKIKLYD